jgi:uncharacterized protein with beta-barrel porin domain
MNGSGATAWSPPVIYSVNGVTPPGEAQLQAGATTTVTITGAGFGYSPILTISGNGVTVTRILARRARPRHATQRSWPP